MQTNPESPETEAIPETQPAVSLVALEEETNNIILDKKSITINILNTTKKKGAAAVLAKKLEEAGFSTATTGNDKTPYNLTTIIINEIKKDYAPLLEEVVKKSYGKVETKISTEQAEFDVTIMIGKQ